MNKKTNRNLRHNKSSNNDFVDTKTHAIYGKSSHLNNKDSKNYASKKYAKNIGIAKYHKVNRNMEQAKFALVCKNYLETNYCKHGDKCYYKHIMKIVQLNQNVHPVSFFSGYMLDADINAEEYEIYTSSKDTILKKWTVSRESDPFVVFGDKNKAQSAQDWSIKLQTTIPMNEMVTKIYFNNNVLVCGMRNGELNITDIKNNNRYSIKAHVSEVQAVHIENGIIYSADFKGVVKTFLPTILSENNLQFQNQYTADLGISITAIKRQSNSSIILIGGLKCVGIYDLHMQKWVNKYTCEGENCFCMQILELVDCYICVFSNANIYVLNKNSKSLISKHVLDINSFIICATITYDKDEPFLILGDNEGIVYLVRLQQKVEVFAMYETKYEQIRCLFGTNKFFVLCSSDGSINIYKLLDDRKKT